jgi:hypothetical protein
MQSISTLLSRRVAEEPFLALLPLTAARQGF